MEGAGPELFRTKLYQAPRRGDRRELGRHSMGELSARVGGRSDAVLDQWETGKSGKGGAGVGGRRGWSKAGFSCPNPRGPNCDRATAGAATANQAARCR